MANDKIWNLEEMEANFNELLNCCDNMAKFNETLNEKVNQYGSNLDDTIMKSAQELITNMNRYIVDIRKTVEEYIKDKVSTVIDINDVENDIKTKITGEAN